MDWNALWAKLITSLDFTAIANGLLGIVLLLLSALGIRRGRQLKAEDKVEKPEVTKTSIITADSVAMDQLADVINASSTILTENNVLRREEHADRQAWREALEANTAALQKAESTIAEARTEIRELTREIVRSAK